MNNERKNVFEAYNVIARWFAKNRSKTLTEKSYLDKLVEITGEKATILDLGCGTGVPIMKHLLNRGLEVLGVDASEEILKIARNNLPAATFFQTDMRQLLISQKFDAIIAWHSFIHLPPEDQPRMFTVFRNHLKNKGVLLFTSGTTYGEVWAMNGGVNLCHGSLDTSHYKELLESNDFQILQYKENDPDCGYANVWMAQLSI